MKRNIRLVLPGLMMALSACGQPGPLYLPADKPPVYVPPEEHVKDEPEGKQEATSLPPSDEDQQKPPQQ